jgi:ABC-type Fe3+/spermidine/putrescine transport system ATPase subunit
MQEFSIGLEGCLSGRVPAYLAGGPDFKSQYHKKCSIKYGQPEFKNISKRAYTTIQLVSFQDGGMFQHMQIHECNIAYKQKQGQKSHDRVNRYRKGI